MCWRTAPAPSWSGIGSTGRWWCAAVSTLDATSEWPLELTRGCVACTVRDDLLVLLRRLHRRSDVQRIVVVLMPWLEPEPVCWAIDNIRVRVGPGYVDGPAARDVRDRRGRDVRRLADLVEPGPWRRRARRRSHRGTGGGRAGRVRRRAGAVTEPEPKTLAVLRRLAPLSRITVGTARVEMALDNLESDTRRGRSSLPHDPLLAGQPSLDSRR